MAIFQVNLGTTVGRLLICHCFFLTCAVFILQEQAKTFQILLDTIRPCLLLMSPASILTYLKCSTQHHLYIQQVQTASV